MGETEKPIRIVRCPTCERSCRYDTSNPFRPFCSERCKNIDIAGWATESFKIAGENVDPEEVLGQDSANKPAAEED